MRVEATTDTTTPDFLGHWKLRERPFEGTWDTRYFFASREHDEALHRLLYLVEENTMNLGLLSGEIGCGKTLTRAVFSERLDPRKYRVVTLENSGFSFGDLLSAVLRRMDPALPSGGTKFERCERLEGAIRRLHAEGRHLVLLLDEAQDMPAATLHELRWITNFNGGGVALLTVVLIGQPELRPLVAGDAAIDQRISLRFHLRPMTVGDVPNYLAHRMRTAGHADGRLFTEGAAVRLHEASGGVPRQVNRLAKLALEHAWLAGSPRVDVDAVSAVVRDLERHQAIPA